MGLFGSEKPKVRKQGAIVALESLSPDVLSAQLVGLEAELHGAGLSVRRLEFPSSGAEENIAGLVNAPQLLGSERALGIIAALDRARVLITAAAEAIAHGEVVLLTGSVLTTAAWLASRAKEPGDRVALYRWLDELEYTVFAQRRMDLVVLLDCLPMHIDIQEAVVAPTGWGNRSVPVVEELRTAYLEAARLFPNTKILSCHREALLKPDSEIQNELWNLVRRIALKTNLPPRAV